MKKAIQIIFIIFVGLLPLKLQALKIQFHNNIGRKYRIKNIIRQDIFLNGRFNSSREAMNKATLEIITNQDQWAKYTGKYYYYSKNLNYHESYKLENVYQTLFYRDLVGNMKIDDIYLMPTTRNIPVFPTNDIQPGDTWKGVGEEIHEGILDKKNWFKFNVDVTYTYVGIITNEGKALAHILIDYHIMYFPKSHNELHSITGYSYNNYYWDIEKGGPHSYSDNFGFVVTLLNGEIVEYKGKSQAIVEELTDIKTDSKVEMISQISNAISSDKGTSVKSIDDGIIVNLGHILFNVNKANLKKGSYKILDKVVEFLRKYPQMDIEVSGHTDNTGQSHYNQLLSENRAKTVSDYFLHKGLSSNRISYMGFGSNKPIASNLTPEGRALNRRVEIKIITKE